MMPEVLNVTIRQEKITMTKKLKPNMYVQRKILNVNNKKYMSQGLVRKVQKVNDAEDATQHGQVQTAVNDSARQHSKKFNYEAFQALVVQ